MRVWSWVTFVASLSLFVVSTGCNDSKLAGRAPAIEVSPSSVLFEPVQPGAPGNTKILTVSNHGGGTLTVSGIHITGATSSAFTAAGPASGFPALGPGGWFAVQVTFAPTDAGPHSGTMTIDSNDPSTPHKDVLLTTTALAPNLEASPNPLNLQATVNASVNGTITVTNTGSADLHVTGAQLGAGTSTFFTLAAVTATTLTPGQSMTLTVTFLPTSTAAASGSVDIASDDPDSATTSVAINGNGAVPNAAQIQAVPNPINFGDVQRLTCSTKTTSVKNVGNAALNVTSITRNIITSTDVTWTPNAFTLQPGAAQTLSVTWCPSQTGGLLGGLDVHSNASNGNPTYGITLLGNGTPPPVSQTDIAIKLTWNENDTDVDTHLWIGTGTGPYDTQNDCYYSNCVTIHPDWGVVGDHSDDPFLDTDNTTGYGPENLDLSNAATNTYTAAIYYYSDHGHGGSTIATATVYVGGTQVYTGSMALTNNQLWTLGTISWNHATHHGTWAPVGTVVAWHGFTAPTGKPSTSVWQGWTGPMLDF